MNATQCSAESNRNGVVARQRLRDERPQKLERVLYNLLTNALRHTPSDGSVAVRVEPNASEVRVSVEDTGVVMRQSGGMEQALDAVRDIVVQENADSDC